MALEAMGDAVRRPVEGEVHVSYAQLYVESDPDTFGPDLREAFAGQVAGLCGAAVPGSLWLNTGLHTGHVGFTVDVHGKAPALDPVWDEVVEVSFRPVSASTRLVQWAGEASWELGLQQTDYRVRYCAVGWDRGRDQDTRLSGEPQLDRYLLQFWPAPPEPDRVIRQTSDNAAYWHDYARGLPPAPTPAERAEAARLGRLAEEEAAREHQLALEQRAWGGLLPSEALRNVRGNVRGLVEFDAALVHAIDAAGPATQRAVALLAARRACQAAGLADLDWIAAGLSALAQERVLPSPFDGWEEAWQALGSDPRVPDRVVEQAVPPGRSRLRAADREGVGTSTMAGTAAAEAPRISQPHLAFRGLLDAAATDPLRAALDAVFAGVVTYGAEYPSFLREVRRACGNVEDPSVSGE